MGHKPLVLIGTTQIELDAPLLPSPSSQPHRRRYYANKYFSPKDLFLLFCPRTACLLLHTPPTATQIYPLPPRQFAVPGLRRQVERHIPPSLASPDKHKELLYYTSPTQLAAPASTRHFYYSLLVCSHQTYARGVEKRHSRALKITLVRVTYIRSSQTGKDKDKDQPSRTLCLYRHLLEFRETKNIINQKGHLLSAIVPPAWDTALSRSKNSHDDRATLDGHGQQPQFQPAPSISPAAEYERWPRNLCDGCFAHKISDPTSKREPSVYQWCLILAPTESERSATHQSPELHPQVTCWL